VEGRGRKRGGWVGKGETERMGGTRKWREGRRERGRGEKEKRQIFHCTCLHMLISTSKTFVNSVSTY